MLMLKRYFKGIVNQINSILNSNSDLKKIKTMSYASNKAIYSPLNLADCWSLEGPRDVSTEERVERATTRHTAGPVEASVPSVSDSSVEHCCKTICGLIQRNIEKKKKKKKGRKRKRRRRALEQIDRQDEEEMKLE